MNRARAAALAIALAAAPALVAGCVSPPDNVEVTGGGCREVAIGWYRWIADVPTAIAVRAMDELDLQPEFYRPEDGDPNSTWIVFRPDQQSPRWNNTEDNIRGVYRTFSSVGPDDGTEIATPAQQRNETQQQQQQQQPQNGTQQQILISVIYDPPDTGEVRVTPGDVQLLHVRNFLEKLNQTLVNQITDAGAPVSAFTTVRNYCAGAGAYEDPGGVEDLDVLPNDLPAEEASILRNLLLGERVRR